jgi:hypothetical protein
MSVEIACCYLGAIPREVFFASVAPALHPFRLPGGHLRYDRQDLDMWVNANGSQTLRRSDSDWLRELNDDDD